MTGRRLSHLKIVYIWGLVFFLVSVIYELQASARALLLLAAFVPIVIVHFRTSVHSSAWKTKKAFFILSLLWGIKFVSFGISEGLYFFAGQGISVLDWLDLLCLLMIALMVSFSFLFNNPFFYEKTKSRVIVLVGVLGLLLFLWTTAMVGLSLVDLQWTHSSLIKKIR